MLLKVRKHCTYEQAVDASSPLFCNLRNSLCRIMGCTGDAARLQLGGWIVAGGWTPYDCSLTGILPLGRAAQHDTAGAHRTAHPRHRNRQCLTCVGDPYSNSASATEMQQVLAYLVASEAQCITVCSNALVEAATRGMQRLTALAWCLRPASSRLQQPTSTPAPSRRPQVQPLGRDGRAVKTTAGL